MFKIGWFSTGRGQGSLNLLHAIVDAVKTGHVPAEIAYVFCSREQGDAEGSDRYIQQVKDYGLNLVSLSSRRFRPDLRAEGRRNPNVLEVWRREYDSEITKKIEHFKADIIVLAGYMLIVSRGMCTRFDMINLHPAAPDGPAGTWQEVIWQLIEKRVKLSGNMMHLVTEELDRGPAITYSEFPLQGEGFDRLWKELDETLKTESIDEIKKKDGDNNPLFTRIRQEGVKREIPLVVETVNAFARGDIRLVDKRVVNADGTVLTKAYNLTEEIEKAVQPRAVRG